MAKSAPAKKTRRSSDSRKRLTPAREERGPVGDEVLLGVDDSSIASLAARVREAGGTPIGAYREPFAGKPLLVAVLPWKSVEPTPFQRDLSPTHTKRLAKKIEETGVFLDPLIVVQGSDGQFWTPNGRHRHQAARILGLRSVTALLSPDEDLAFRILALNTEKAHNLKDKSLEVIRMARELAERKPRTREADYEAEFEEPALLTLGLCYQQDGRFAGASYHPVLKRTDAFLSARLTQALDLRRKRATRLLELNEAVGDAVKRLKARGFESPYLRAFVVARINPLRWKRGATADFDETMDTMIAAAKKFNPANVKADQVARSGGPPEE